MNCPIKLDRIYRNMYTSIRIKGELKPVRWMGTSLRDLRSFPRGVRIDVGHALFAAQEGKTDPAAKPLKGFGSANVLEIIASHHGNAWRGVYTVRFHDAIYVLHVFQRKSTRRLRQGFIYLVAILDWFSRYVLGWEMSTSLESTFCLAALEWALRTGCPEIFNTDQGAQFTSEDFTGRLERSGITISMDGRGRAMDNIFVERLWRTVKYEEVYLHDYEQVEDAVNNLKNYFWFYNHVSYCPTSPCC
jgi:transposase InsO family protein